MSYYPDLSPYQYGRVPTKGTHVNVGWLDKISDEHPQPDEAGEPRGNSAVVFGGKIPGEALAVLKRIPARNHYRGDHFCAFCPNPWRDTSKPFNPDIACDSEIWVKGERGRVYCCPSLIIHYIEAHGYVPPQEFVSALLHVAQDRTTG
jgi:hypothetical protein